MLLDVVGAEAKHAGQFPFDQELIVGQSLLLDSE